MKLSQLEYNLPKNLIANSPVEPRDHSKLLILDRESGSIQHKHFYNLIDILGSGDVLVFNNTKVFPARIIGKKETGGKVEVLFLKNCGENVWEILGKNLPSVNHKILLHKFCAIVIEKDLNTAKIKTDGSKKEFIEMLQKEGKTPIPPYINVDFSENSLRVKYQTVYAKVTGSVAAPTAGFHFTKEMFKKLKNKGAQMEYVTLHVGPGTFLPIKNDDLSKHKMHSEWFSLSAQAADRLNMAKAMGKRVISVGTTTTRVLESCIASNGLKAKSGETDIFIYPPYKFQFIDGLITNFHLPHSTLLALVSALVSKPNTNYKFKNFKSSTVGKAYEEAIKNKYRFYSFGDAMLIS